MENSKKNIDVPYFKTIKELSSWVELLSDKEIQSWSTRDWNIMYEKLFSFIETSSEIKEKAKVLIKQNTEEDNNININNLNSDKIKIECFLNDFDCIHSLGKLYKNYRLEPEKLRIIRKKAKSAGHLLVKSSYIDVAEAYCCKMNSDEVYRYSSSKYDSIADVVYQLTSLYKATKRHKEKRLLYSVECVNYGENTDESYGSCSEDENNGSWITMELNEDAYISDRFINTAFHEAAHAFLQLARIINGQKIYPINKLGEEFYRLMEYNHKLYFDPRYHNPFLQELQQTDDYDDDDFRKAVHNDFSAYKRQPIEKFAKFFGLYAQQSYYRESGQLSSIYILKTCSEHFSETLGIDLSANARTSDAGYVELFYDLGDKKINKEMFEVLKSFYCGKDKPTNGLFQFDYFEYGDESNVMAILPKFPNGLSDKLNDLKRNVLTPLKISSERLLEAFSGACSPIYAHPSKNGGCCYFYYQEDLNYSAEQLINKLKKILDKKTLETLDIHAGKKERQVDWEDESEIADVVYINIPKKDSPIYNKLKKVFSQGNVIEGLHDKLIDTVDVCDFTNLIEHLPENLVRENKEIIEAIHDFFPTSENTKFDILNFIKLMRGFGIFTQKDLVGWLEIEKKRDIEKLQKKRQLFVKKSKMKRKIRQILGVSNKKQR